jgi:hypothetical protein
MPVELLTAQDANWNLERGAFNVLIDQSQPALPCRAAGMTSVMLFERQPPTAGRSRPSAPDIWRLLSAHLPTPCCYALRVSTALRSMPMLALRGSALARPLGRFGTAGIRAGSRCPAWLVPGRWHCGLHAWWRRQLLRSQARAGFRSGDCIRDRHRRRRTDSG